ncbi:unnamed protein product [Lymnaea stagnalis]|uniref:CABIT domain-containing protein n=1 Tax=Lymnaea stagnalis TaxID=6523 RepID=A0AAV2IEN5_LYMST
MGLSKKLGAITQRVTGPDSRDVPYKWSNQTYTVQEILHKFKLPCVVQCATEACTVLWSDFQFDLRQPLLFYSRRTVQKVHAISLKADPTNSETLDEIGPPLAIPADYEGWFGATPKGINKIKRHLRIEAVANSAARRFLVTTQCPAFTSSRAPDGSFEYVPHDVMPGEVLKKVCVMEGSPGDPDAPQILKDHGPCLECLDEKDEDVVIPLSRRVMCYELAEEYPDDGERVFRIAAPMTTGSSKFPRIFQLIHGEPPVLKYAFTGMIRCYSVFTEETILAATLDDPKSICLELATDSVARFRIGLNDAAIKRTCEYNNANQICDSFGPKFLTAIKVSFSLKPEFVGQDDVEMSSNDNEVSSNDNEVSSNDNEVSSNDNESLSDMQDVNADSEFEIAWGSVQKTKPLTSSQATDDEGTMTKTENGRAMELVHLQDVRGSKTPFVKPRTLNIESTEQRNDSGDLRDHQAFTEQEMVDLMKKKGLIELKAETIPEFGSIRETRVRDNPLYYFMQRNPDQNPFNGTEEDCISESSKTGDDTLNDAVDDVINDVVYDAVEENPLMYLFQPLTKLEPADVTKNVTELGNLTKESVQQKLSSASSVSGFDQVVCKPAQEYKESHSESDSDGSDSEGSDSDAIDSDGSDGDIFETSPSLAENSTTTLQIRPGILESEYVKRLNNKDANIDDDDDKMDDKNDNKYPIDDNTEYHIYENVDDIYEDYSQSDTDSESHAVDDLMSLALEETEKLSTSSQDVSVTSGNCAQTQPNGGNCVGIMRSSSPAKCEVKPITADGAASSGEKDKSDEAVTRLNSLIEEVTALVNTSSNRILDVRRSPRETSRSRANSNTAKDGDRVSCDDRGSNKRLNDNPGSPSVVDLKTSVTHSTNQTYDTPRSDRDFADVSMVPTLFVQAPSKDNVSVLNVLDTKSDMTASKSDTNVSKSDRVHVLLTEQKTPISTTSTLTDVTPESGRSKSDDTPGVLRRSRAEVNLPSAVPQGLQKTYSAPWLLAVSSTSDPVLNSIVSHEKSLDQRFLSRRITHFPHEHPHGPGETLSRDARPAVGSISRRDDVHLQTVQTNVSSLKGTVLMPLQNSERMISPTCSVSSLNSSITSLNSSITIVSCLNPDMKELDGLSFSEDVPESDSESNSELSHFSVRSERSLVLEKEKVSLKRDSNSDLFKMADKFSFSRSGKLKSGKNKTVGSRARILSQEMEYEDFV